jgi:hypothetical protein
MGQDARGEGTKPVAEARPKLVEVPPCAGLLVKSSWVLAHRNPAHMEDRTTNIHPTAWAENSDRGGAESDGGAANRGAGIREAAAAASEAAALAAIAAAIAAGASA